MTSIFNQLLYRWLLAGVTAITFLFVASCGAGGAGGLIAGISGAPATGSGGGIGGTGLTSNGTLDGAGSIFVNGIRFEIDNADISIDGKAANADELGLGMVVTVTGTVDQDGENGVAERVDYDANLAGQISTVQRDADNKSALLTVLEQPVIIERTSTVFEGTGFDAIAPDVFVEVSGYADNSGRLRATRIARKNDSAGEVLLLGVVSQLQNPLFTIGMQSVDASTAVLTGLAGNGLVNGQQVEVRGRLVDGVLEASTVTARLNLAENLQAEDRVTAQGTVNGFQSLATFVVDGLPVDADSAQLNTGGLPLRDGSLVEVNGLWTGSRLIADTVTSRRGRIKIEAPLVDVDDNTLSFRFGSDLITVTSNARTLFDDDRDDIEYLKIADLRIGDFLELEGLNNGTSLIATRVDRDEESSDSKLQAPLTSFVDGISITLHGITFDVSQAEFQDAADNDISSSLFFANLSPGVLLRVIDRTPADGWAEEVEFEFATALDGDREFLDDDEERLDTAELPDSLIAYLEANFPDAAIAFSEQDDDEIEVYLTDGTELVFTRDGVFLEIEDEHHDRDDSDEAEDEDQTNKDSDEAEDEDQNNEDSEEAEGEDQSNEDSDDQEDQGSEVSEEGASEEQESDDEDPEDPEDPEKDDEDKDATDSEDD